MHEHASVMHCLLAKANAECTFRFPLVGLGLMGIECFSLEMYILLDTCASEKFGSSVWTV